LCIHSNQTTGGWSSVGIVQDNNPGPSVQCIATHITSFAILVGYSDTDRVSDCVYCIVKAALKILDITIVRDNHFYSVI